LYARNPTARVFFWGVKLIRDLSESVFGFGRRLVRSNGVGSDLAGRSQNRRKYGHESGGRTLLRQDVRRRATAARGPAKIGRRSRIGRHRVPDRSGGSARLCPPDNLNDEVSIYRQAHRAARGAEAFVCHYRVLDGIRDFPCRLSYVQYIYTLNGMTKTNKTRII